MRSFFLSFVLLLLLANTDAIPILSSAGVHRHERLASSSPAAIESHDVTTEWSTVTARSPDAGLRRKSTASLDGWGLTTLRPRDTDTNAQRSQRSTERSSTPEVSADDFPMPPPSNISPPYGIYSSTDNRRPQRENYPPYGLSSSAPPSPQDQEPPTLYSYPDLWKLTLPSYGMSNSNAMQQGASSRKSGSAGNPPADDPTRPATPSSEANVDCKLNCCVIC